MWILQIKELFSFFSVPKCKIITIVVLHGSTCSKKKKVVQNSMDQSIQQLNDVTAVSGVNLRVSFVFPDSFSFHFKSGCVVLNFAVCIDFFFFLNEC